jgi:RNA polymerase sigma-70 factor, ECF subfamily
VDLAPEEPVTAITTTLVCPPAAQPPADAAVCDHALIERAKVSSDALAALYRKYQPIITGYVLRRVRNRHDAEDIIANVFLAMVRGLRQYQASQAPFVVWLYRIATNEINWWIRKRRARAFLGLASDRPGPDMSPRDDAEVVRVTLAKLPVRYQNVLSLHYLQGLSVQEVASVLHVAVGTVKSRLARGRDLLRDRIPRD